MKLAKGLKVTDEIIGSGPKAKKNDIVHVSCSCKFKNGNILFSTEVVGLFQFRLGFREAFVALEQGVVGMQKGGCRKIKVPPNLTYYEREFYPTLSENAVLYYDVELVEITNIWDSTLHIRTSTIYSESTLELEKQFRNLKPTTDVKSEFQKNQGKLFTQANEEYKNHFATVSAENNK